MTSTTLSSQEFDQNPGQAQIATNNGPVFITECGRTSFVLLNFDEYLKLMSNENSIHELLVMPEAAEIEFEPPRMGDEVVMSADLS